jgi:thymidine kinase
MSITLYMGPMFSGKTSSLINVLEQLEGDNKSYCIIKYKKDTRYSDKYISSHQGQIFECKDTFLCEKIMEVINEISNFDYVIIDEGNMYDDIDQYVPHLADNGKDVYVSCLNGTFDRKLFGKVHNLIPFCDNIVTLKAECNNNNCNNNAVFSHRISQNKETIMVGGSREYKSLCRKCFLKNN